MKLDASLRDSWSITSSGWKFFMPEGWMQGRTVFGGLTAAAAAGLAIRQVDAARRLRTLSLQLMKAISPGEVHGTFRVMQEGKNVTFAQVALWQGNSEVAAANMVFASPRPGASHFESPPWSGPDAQSLSDLPYLEGMMPEFTQHLSLRWAYGGYPYSGADEARFGGYCRFRVPSGDVEGVLALLDAWPCPSLALMRKPTPASTVAWTAHVLNVPSVFDGWFAFAYETVAGDAGFHTTVGRLFGPDGRLVGWTEQLVGIYE